MTDKEKTIKELKEALDSLDITNKYLLNLIRAIEYLQEEPESEDLEEAAIQYAGKHAPYDDAMDEVEEAFKAGAHWKEQQMTKDAEEVENDRYSY